MGPSAPIVVAHRGGEAYAPENTLVAFEQTIAFGIQWAETDLRVSRDGEIVLFHDCDLDRTTDGSGPLVDQSLKALQRLDAGHWFDPWFAGQPIPTLNQLFDRCGTRLHYLLEIKTPGHLEEHLVRSIETADMHSQVVVIGSDPDALERVKTLDSRVEVGYVAHEPIPEKIERALAMGAHHIAFLPRCLTAEIVRATTARGLRVRSTHAHNETEMRHVLECGVFALVLSDAHQRRF